MKERIEKIMKWEEMSASKFADAIGVQRSSISHIISGRNKPSLELVNKILDRFDNLNADWLLLGKGEMLATKEPVLVEQLVSSAFDLPDKSPRSTKDAKVSKIVIFYSDGTFKDYNPS